MKPNAPIVRYAQKKAIRTPFVRPFPPAWQELKRLSFNQGRINILQRDMWAQMLQGAHGAS